MDNKPILEVRDLCKTMGGRPIIKSISFDAYAGEVFGFLGPNGAGKTTTIKMMLGLLSIDSGTVTIDGHNTVKEFETAMENVGGIVENPELYKYLTGWQNLKQYARIRKNISKERMEYLVEFVGLQNRIKEKVKRYSLGMKQRLGIAQSLLHSPRLLVLDEPTNGLDPAGIKELRDILKKIAHELNSCVFVSSHLLSEMELMCDRVCIIADGNILGVKPIGELMHSQETTPIYRFTVSNVEAALAALALPRETFSEITATTFDLPIESEQQLADINMKLITAGIMLMGCTRLERRLEDIFIEITKTGGTQIA